MTLATSRSFKTIREQIGPALWLLELLAAYTPKDWADEVAWVARRKWNDRAKA
jgi:hypothetical protein